MKGFILVPLVLAGALAAALGAQQQSTVSSTTAVDINGHRIPEGPETIRQTSPNGTEITEKMQSINGRMVPLERTEEKVLRDDSSGRVVERVVRRYDPQGNPLPPTKETIEEQKRPDGSTTTQTTTYRGDINGSMQLIEKSTSDTHKTDSTETAETVIQRPNINGGIETVEKRDSTKSKSPDGSYQEESNVYRRNSQGSLYQAVRETTQHTVQGTEATDNTAEYEIGATGQLQLHGQTVSKTVTHPDGSKDVVVDIFGQNVPGTVSEPGRPLKLQERQFIQETPGPGNTTVETKSVRRPTVSNPNTLGPEQQLSQTVCKGDCKP